MKLLIESWRNFINEGQGSTPKIITVDFDDTIRMTDGGYPNTEVIDKIKQFKVEGAKVYIVTSRKDTSDNKLFIDDFLDKNNVSHDGIHLTDMKDKWYNVRELGSNMHFVDDDEKFKAIKHHIEEFSEDKQNIKLMKVDHSTGKILKDLDEVYSDKQRRWACSQIDNSSSLTKKQAKEMCKGPTLRKK